MYCASLFMGRSRFYFTVFVVRKNKEKKKITNKQKNTLLPSSIMHRFIFSDIGHEEQKKYFWEKGSVKILF